MTRNEAGLRNGIIFRLQHAGCDPEKLREEYRQLAVYAEEHGYHDHARDIRAAMEEFETREVQQ